MWAILSLAGPDTETSTALHAALGCVGKQHVPVHTNRTVSTALWIRRLKYSYTPLVNSTSFPTELGKKKRSWMSNHSLFTCSWRWKHSVPSSEDSWWPLSSWPSCKLKSLSCQEHVARSPHQTSPHLQRSDLLGVQPWYHRTTAQPRALSASGIKTHGCLLPTGPFDLEFLLWTVTQVQ